MNTSLSIQQLKQGNQKVFEQIIKSYWPRLNSFAYIYVLDKEVVKEIVQDTFLALWDQRRNLDNETCLITYLMVVSRNKCLNYLKSLQLETIPISDLNEFTVYQRSNLYVMEDESLGILVAKELNLAIEASLEKLSHRTREIFRMSRYEGLKNREIAEREHITVKAVEFHINKALTQLRSDLSKDYFVVFLCILFYVLNKK